MQEKFPWKNPFLYWKMDDHVFTVFVQIFWKWPGYYQLKKIRQIRKYLSRTATEQLVHAFVTSNIDYCNAILYGAPKFVINKLQKLQNAAARIICGGSRYESAVPLLIELHWLPVTHRIKYKIAILAFKSRNNLAPDYLEDLLEPYVPGRTLRSSQQGRLKVPRCRTETFGPRAFTAAAPQVWNSLPDYLRLSKDFPDFKSKLKTFYFKDAFKI